MERDRNMIPGGGPNWVPWLGLGLVLPAVIVFLVGISGFLSAAERGTNGHIRLGEGPGIMGIAGAAIVAVAAFTGLMLGVLGLVRAARIKTPRDGTNVGIAGGFMDVTVVVLAVLALASLAWLAM
jgi:hypothetical protein